MWNFAGSNLQIRLSQAWWSSLQLNSRPERKKKVQPSSLRSDPSVVLNFSRNTSFLEVTPSSESSGQCPYGKGQEDSLVSDPELRLPRVGSLGPGNSASGSNKGSLSSSSLKPVSLRLLKAYGWWCQTTPSRVGCHPEGFVPVFRELFTYMQGVLVFVL